MVIRKNNNILPQFNNKNQGYKMQKNARIFQCKNGKYYQFGAFFEALRFDATKIDKFNNFRKKLI